MDDVSIDAMAEFLANALPPDTAPAVLVEARKILPHPDYEGTPAGVFSWDAATLAALVMLPMQPLRVPFTFGCYEVPEKEAIVVHHILNVGQPNALLPNRHQPRMLNGELLRGCAKLLIAKDPVPAQSAAVAGLLARAPGAYYYWSTFGEPPSLGDVISYHRTGDSQMLVGTPTEEFRVRLRPGPHTDEDISLTYMLALQAHQDITANDASKLALVHVCGECGYDLRCYSRRADARGVDPRRVWPWPDEDAWALEEIRRLCS